MPSSALKLVGAATPAPAVEPEEELEHLYAREDELRKAIAVNLSLQADAVRRLAEKHRLKIIPRLETVKAGIIAGRAAERAKVPA